MSLRRSEVKQRTLIRSKADNVLISKAMERLGFNREDDLELEKKGDKLWLVTTKEKAEILKRAEEKIARIKEDIINSVGLTQREARIAIDTGLVPEDQGWWWLESWQKGEREVERNKLQKNYQEFDNIEDLIRDLDS